MRCVGVVLSAVCMGLCVALCGLWEGAVEAHLGLHEEIVRLSLRLRKAPEDVGLLLRRSDLYRRHGDIELAVADLRRVDRLSPKHPQRLLYWGRLWFSVGRWEEAEAALGEAKRAKVVSWEVYALLAQLLQRKQRWEEALGAYKTSVRLRPQPHLYLAAGGIMEKKGRWEEAVRWYREGAGVLKGAVVLQLALLEVLRKQGRWEEAIRVVEVAMLGLPVRADGWMRRADLYERMGKKDSAKKDRLLALEEVRGLLRRRPSSLNRGREVQILWSLGRVEEARRCVERWLRVYPKDAEGLRWQARLKGENR